MIKRVLAAVVCGVAVTFSLLGISVVLDELGYESAARALFWQNGALQALVPPIDIGSTNHPIREGSPLNFLAFLASIPLGFFIYGLAGFVILTWVACRRRTA